ncbi:MAG: hypothetical protein MJE68_01560 [Proteobacteria bacterium]|nr:hypothetical protein [Pseudomonadota bacterium]
MGQGLEESYMLHVINITFTLLDEGQKARADSGNHLIAILQAPEKYEHLKCGLDQVCRGPINFHIGGRWGELYDRIFPGW